MNANDFTNTLIQGWFAFYGAWSLAVDLGAEPVFGLNPFAGAFIGTGAALLLATIHAYYKEVKKDG